MPVWNYPEYKQVLALQREAYRRAMESQCENADFVRLSDVHLKCAEMKRELRGIPKAGSYRPERPSRRSGWTASTTIGPLAPTPTSETTGEPAGESATVETLDN